MTRKETLLTRLIDYYMQENGNSEEKTKEPIEDLLKRYETNNIFYIKEKMLDTDPEIINCIEFLDVQEIEIINCNTQLISKFINFKHLHKIKKISFINSSVSDFFKNSKYLKDLEHILIHEFDETRAITSQRIDDGIGYLKNLEYFHIVSPSLTYISEEIGNLSELKTLMLDISIDLPETISSLKSINNLSINISNENTDTEKLLNQVLPLKNLLGFHYQNPYTHFLPRIDNYFFSLKHLSLELFNFKEIPSFIQNIETLKSLTFRECKLESIPPWITKLKNLEYLDFTGTAIKKLPLFLNELPKLKLICVMVCLEMEEILPDDFPNIVLEGI